ncbi:peptidoglycan-recognition protein LC-like, partial [Chelonus insularis]|uniref:peptidoglycan-recognition protein LC-like n=1 Tax=Chelonus insularis TaxID=460826 RepID=UPI00158F45C5
LIKNIEGWSPLEFVKLREWDSFNSTSGFINIKLPIIPRHVVISHTATPQCVYKNDCEFELSYSISRPERKDASPEVFANFYIGGDGRVYIGRDWESIGVNNFGCEQRTPIIEISLIGHFRYSQFSKKQFLATQQLLEEGILNKKISYDYELHGVWQLVNNITPSNMSNIASTITNWLHWSSNSLQCLTSISENSIE